jgi:aconitase A
MFTYEKRDVKGGRAVELGAAEGASANLGIAVGDLDKYAEYEKRDVKRVRDKIPEDEAVVAAAEAGRKDAALAARAQVAEEKASAEAAKRTVNGQAAQDKLAADAARRSAAETDAAARAVTKAADKVATDKVSPLYLEFFTPSPGSFALSPESFYTLSPESRTLNPKP